MNETLMLNQNGHSPDLNDLVLRFLKRVYSRVSILYLLMGILLIIAIVLLGKEVGTHINAIETWIENLGPWSMIVFIGLFIITTSLLLPETLPAIIAGVLFGIGWGLFTVVVGGFLSAILQYMVSKNLFHTQIQRLITSRPALAAIQKSINHDAVRLQILLRLTPLNPATISYLLGAAGVRFSGFLFSCLALTPNLFIEVYLGYAGKHIARAAGRSTQEIYMHDLFIIGSLIAFITVLVFISKIAHKAVMNSVTENKN